MCRPRGCRAGEMIVGPKRVLFMDEISTGLDSSTTYAIIKQRAAIISTISRSLRYSGFTRDFSVVCIGAAYRVELVSPMFPR